MGKSRRRKHTSIQATKYTSLYGKKARMRLDPTSLAPQWWLNPMADFNLLSKLSQMATFNLSSNLSKLLTKSPNALQAPQTLARMNEMSRMRRKEVGECFIAQANSPKREKCPSIFKAQVCQESITRVIKSIFASDHERFWE